MEAKYTFIKNGLGSCSKCGEDMVTMIPDNTTAEDGTNLPSFVICTKCEYGAGFVYGIATKEEESNIH